MTLEETVKGFKRIVQGDLDNVPAQAFYMEGGIGEVAMTARAHLMRRWKWSRSEELPTSMFFRR